MVEYRKHVPFTGKMLFLGFGSIAQGVLPLMLRHIEMTPDQITILTAQDTGRAVAKACKVKDFRVQTLTRDTHVAVLNDILKSGDILVNLACNVSSPDLIAYCLEHGIIYVDADLWPWVTNAYPADAAEDERSSYDMREKTLALRQKSWPTHATASITQGVNPGLVSHFLKQALINMARDTGNPVPAPTTREGWAALAQSLNIKTIHISERDTQVADRPKQPGEFINTWSITGLLGEGSDPAELGWGSHEKHWPHYARAHSHGSRSAIAIEQPGLTVKVRTWAPLEGPFHGFLITHGESISIPDYLSIKDGDNVVYRPTVHYAYHPCDDAVLSIHEYCGKSYQAQKHLRIIRDEITSGMDELGVLLCGNPKGVYWYGSRLTIDEARKLAPYNNATTLQTVAGVLAGVIWSIENPANGITEPDEMDFRRMMDIASPYLGEMVGVWGEWSPLDNRETLFPEDLDREDPWQFKNILVS